jgi:hypothetical protein
MCLRATESSAEGTFFAAAPPLRKTHSSRGIYDFFLYLRINKKEVYYLHAHIYTILLCYFYIGQYLLIWTYLGC